MHVRAPDRYLCVAAVGPSMMGPTGVRLGVVTVVSVAMASMLQMGVAVRGSGDLMSRRP